MIGVGVVPHGLSPPTARVSLSQLETKTRDDLQLVLLNASWAILLQTSQPSMVQITQSVQSVVDPNELAPIQLNHYLADTLVLP